MNLLFKYYITNIMALYYYLITNFVNYFSMATDKLFGVDFKNSDDRAMLYSNGFILDKWNY